MNNTTSLTWTGRAALAVMGASAAAFIGFAAPAAADPGVGGGCNSAGTTTSAGGSTTSGGSGAGTCTPNTSGANGIGPGGPAYNGTDPRS